MPKRKYLFTQNERPQKKAAAAIMDTTNNTTATVVTPNRRCIGDPDVTVVVGGVPFHHYSFLLCYGSEYFDTMLSSGMSESQNKVIEFPDKNPAEWKLVYPFLEPRSLSTAEAVKITKDNAKSIIPWFHEFGMSKLLKEADDRLWSSLLLFKHGCYPSDHRTLSDRKRVLSEILQWMETSDRYELPKTRAAMVKELKKALTDFPELITRDLLQQMMPMLCNDVELWDTAKSMLPDHVVVTHATATTIMCDDELKSNPLFLDLLCQSYKVAWLEKQKKIADESINNATSRQRLDNTSLDENADHRNNNNNANDPSARLLRNRVRSFRNRILDVDLEQRSLARRIAIRRRIALRQRENLRRVRNNAAAVAMNHDDDDEHHDGDNDDESNDNAVVMNADDVFDDFVDGVVAPGRRVVPDDGGR
mmetsp:Transcript_18936/g.28050  ORF Transcript_18936/g.28050 Transcript_18936/m.28050 type:complete len:420 (-) Transcript_18936:141-1400(-)